MATVAVEIVAREFVVDKPYEMYSGIAEAAKYVYRKLVDKKGHVWLYAVNCDHPAETVHFHDPEDKHSDGYAGNTLHFVLEDGTVYDAKGPWHSNSDAMFEKTGVDIRNTYRTFGCVALRRKYENHISKFIDVLHLDKESTLGTFDRLEKIALDWADKLGHPVACYRESRGGSSSGYEIPRGTEWRSWTEWFKQQAE